MNSKKSNILIPELSLEPDYIDEGSESSFVVLFKHNYYGSDNEHGKNLLFKYIQLFNDDPLRISKLIFIDSGVKLLDQNNDLFTSVSELVGIIPVCLVCEESISFYDIKSPLLDEVSKTNSYHIFSEICDSDKLIIIE